MATLEEIQLKVDEVKSKIPSIKQGIEALSASDLSEGASAVDVPDIGDQPTTAGTVSNGAGSTADTAVAVVDAEEQRLKDEAEARQKEIDEAAKVKQNWLDKLTTTGKTSEEKLAEEEEEAGVAGLSDDAKTQKLKVAGIQGDLAKLESRYLVDVDREGDRLASSGAIGLAENKITREYQRNKAYLSADLYAEAAVLDVYSGNLTDARNAAKDAVTAFMYDQEQEVKRFEYLYDYHSDFLDSLKAEDKAIVDEAKLKAEEEKAKVEAEKTNVMNMMLQYPKAGIKLTDSLEEASVKASNWSGQQPTTIDTKAPTTKMVNGVLHEWDAVNGEWKPSKIATTETGEIPAPPAYVSSFGQYKDAGWTRTQVENNWISQYNAGKTAGMQIKDINEMNKSFPEIKSALDEVYKSTTPGTWEILKEVPGVVGDWVSNLFK